MFLLSRKSESECLLVFDIGSGSVGGAIVISSAGHIPTILYSFRTEIPFQEAATGQRLSSLMLRSLSQVVIALSREGLESAGFGAKRPRIKRILVSLSAPWAASLTSFLSLKNKEWRLITEKVFDALLSHSANESNSPKGLAPKGSVKIEKMLMKASLNGYETSAPYGKEALDAEFAIFSSFSLPRVTENIADVITHLFHVEHTRFHAFSLIAFMTLKKMYPEEENFIFVDVSGEQTEISIARNRIIVETSTFPSGRNHIIRMLKKGAGIPPLGAEAFFRLYNEKSGAGKIVERIEKLLENAKEDWRGKFAETLSALSQEIFFPKSLFIVADSDVLPLFTRAIGGLNLEKFALPSKKFRVTPLNGELIAGVVKWNTPEKNDPFMGIVSSFASELR